MTRDEYRIACIEAMARILWGRNEPGPDWYEYIPDATAAFDALRKAGVRVVPAEATQEMVRAGLKVRPTVRETWNAMSAAGDLTNPPEGKP